jgi:uncharacterized protein YfaT (DUF1175 family)
LRYIESLAALCALSLMACSHRGAGPQPAAGGQRAYAASFALTDRAGDGIPDFLRLNGDDATAFRQWFTFLAEVQYYRNDLPPEIDDCAALIRYACREALSRHDDAWAARVKLPIVPPLPPVTKYTYPLTPLRAGLFRTRPGPFTDADLTNGAFSQFADAKTLERYNTRCIGRDLRQARPGDLLFFRQAGGTLPFHSMIWLGRSQFERDSDEYAIYHTGPFGGGRGEIRRLTADQLLHHPEPRWRPVEGNSNFLGVYRWNIL